MGLSPAICCYSPFHFTNERMHFAYFAYLRGGPAKGGQSKTSDVGPDLFLPSLVFVLTSCPCPYPLPVVSLYTTIQSTTRNGRVEQLRLSFQGPCDPLGPVGSPREDLHTMQLTSFVRRLCSLETLESGNRTWLPVAAQCETLMTLQQSYVATSTYSTARLSITSVTVLIYNPKPQFFRDSHATSSTLTPNRPLALNSPLVQSA